MRKVYRSVPRRTVVSPKLMFPYDAEGDWGYTATQLIEDEMIIEEWSGLLDEYGNPIMNQYEKEPIGFYLGETEE